MGKEATITVRLPAQLRSRLAARARREKRSLSAQVEHELERALANEPDARKPRGKFQGRYLGSRVPTEADLREVRALLWGRLGNRDQ